MTYVIEQRAVCTDEACQAEIRPSNIRCTDLRPRRHYIEWPRQQVEAVCPSCSRVYRFTRRMVKSPFGACWEIEGSVEIVTDPKEASDIKARVIGGHKR